MNLRQLIETYDGMRNNRPVTDSEFEKALEGEIVVIDSYRGTHYSPIKLRFYKGDKISFVLEVRRK